MISFLSRHLFSQYKFDAIPLPEPDMALTSRTAVVCRVSAGRYQSNCATVTMTMCNTLYRYPNAILSSPAPGSTKQIRFALTGMDLAFYLVSTRSMTCQQGFEDNRKKN